MQTTIESFPRLLMQCMCRIIVQCWPRHTLFQPLHFAQWPFYLLCPISTSLSSTSSVLRNPSQMPVLSKEIVYSHCYHNNSSFHLHSVIGHPIMDLPFLFPNTERTFDHVLAQGVMKIKPFLCISKTMTLPTSNIAKFLKMIFNDGTLIGNHLPRPVCELGIYQEIFFVH